MQLGEVPSEVVWGFVKVHSQILCLLFEIILISCIITALNIFVV